MSDVVSLAKRRRVLVVVAIAELLAMWLWSSATAAAPELAAEWALTDTETAWLTISVQLGFVAGALLPSALTLSDVVKPRYLFAGSALAGAALTAIIAAAVSSALPAIVLRFLTGMALAGIYPPGIEAHGRLVSGGARVRHRRRFRPVLGLRHRTGRGELRRIGPYPPNRDRVPPPTISIQLTPMVADLVGWRWAFAPLAIGPLLGTVSMLRLRGLPETAKLAGGRG